MLAVAALLATTAACTRTAPTSSERPNVLLISVDSLRADHVSSYGYARETTPTIDRLARDGVTFAHAVSTTSWTLPAHAALLTGRHDAEHGATLPQSSLDPSIPTLAEALGAAGYRTVGLYSGPFLDPTFGLERGFEQYVACTSDSALIDGSRKRSRARAHVASHKDVTNPLVARAFTRAVAGRDARPTFFFVHLWDVHYDLLPPPPYAGMFDPEYDGNFPGHAYRHAPGFKPGMAKADYEHVLALYDGEIRFTDDTIAGMLADLERSALLANTVVIVTSDHGDEFLEHGGKGHRRTLFQEVLAIPLVFWAPGRLAPSVANTSASLVDVAPTILAITGAPGLEGITGRSLIDSTGAPLVDDRVAIAELRFNASRPALKAAFAHPHKVVVDARRRTSEYYDLEADPGERSPGDPQSLDAGRRLVEALDRFYEAPARSWRSPDTPEKKLTPAMEKRLRALGYLD
jgi:arylsulfatase A-like enzyme